MLAAIDGAERTIGLATYIFDRDPLGLRFLEALAGGEAGRRSAGARRLGGPPLLVACDGPGAAPRRGAGRPFPPLPAALEAAVREPAQPPQDPHRGWDRRVRRRPEPAPWAPPLGEPGQPGAGPPLPLRGAGGGGAAGALRARLAVHHPGGARRAELVPAAARARAGHGPGDRRRPRRGFRAASLDAARRARRGHPLGAAGHALLPAGSGADHRARRGGTARGGDRDPPPARNNLGSCSGRCRRSSGRCSSGAAGSGSPRRSTTRSFCSSTTAGRSSARRTGIRGACG